MQTSLLDEQIAEAVQKGDHAAFGEIMSRYERKLFRYGKRFLSDEENIIELVQDVFLKTFKNINSFDSNLKFSSWIYRIAHNTFVNALRKKKRTALTFTQAFNPLGLTDIGFDLDTFLPHEVAQEDEHMKESDIQEYKILIDKGMKNLSEKYKDVLILYFNEDMGYKEIADILQIPVGTVGIRLKRAKEELKKNIDQNHPSLLSIRNN